MLHRPALTDAQRDLMIGTAIVAIVRTPIMLGVAWALVALVVGSIDLVRWIGGL
jgi:hypothetical protein